MSTPQPSFASPPKKSVKAPVKTVESKSVAYVVVKGFSQYLGSSMTTFAAGTVITKPYLVDALLKAKAPIIPVQGSGSVHSCPHCGKAFLGG